METSSKPEFVRILTGMAAVKRIDLTTEAFEIWWLALADWDIEDFRSAAAHLIKTCEFMPGPHDFEKLKRLSRLSAQEAWSQALSFADGQWRTEQHPDDRINRVVEMLGGWRTLALTNVEKLGFVQRRFVDAYADLNDGEDTRAALPSIAGEPLQRIGRSSEIAGVLEQAADSL